MNEDEIDALMGITADVKSRIANAVDEIYPDRAPSVRAAIIANIANVWFDNDIALSRDMLRNLAKISPDLVRETPTLATALAWHAEQHAKTFGTPMTAQQRLVKHRELEKLTPDELVAALPATVTNAPPASQTTTTAPTTVEARDAEIEKRFGLQIGGARALSAMTRARYHRELEREELAKRPIAAIEVPQTGDMRSVYSRMNAARAAK